MGAPEVLLCVRHTDRQSLEDSPRVVELCEKLLHHHTSRVSVSVSIALTPWRRTARSVAVAARVLLDLLGALAGHTHIDQLVLAPVLTIVVDFLPRRIALDEASSKNLDHLRFQEWVVPAFLTLASTVSLAVHDRQSAPLPQ